MNKALLQKPVGELTTDQLRDVYEQRLLDEGLASLDRGEGILVSPEYFEEKRKRLKKDVGTRLDYHAGILSSQATYTIFKMP